MKFQATAPKQMTPARFNEDFVISNEAGYKVTLTIQHSEDVPTGRIYSSIAELHQFAVTLSHAEVTNICDNLVTLAMRGKHNKVAELLSNHLVGLVNEFRMRMQSMQMIAR